MASLPSPAGKKKAEDRCMKPEKTSLPSSISPTSSSSSSLQPSVSAVKKKMANASFSSSAEGPGDVGALQMMNVAVRVCLQQRTKQLLQAPLQRRSSIPGRLPANLDEFTPDQKYSLTVESTAPWLNKVVSILKN